ncbi:MAG: hypothetical protein FJ253_07465, partial [Phycisphaerae bacterium]|nr:hypothetical protein [Phycisphaerae bacterium]
MSLQALQHLRQRLKRRRKRIAFVVGAALLMTAAIWGVLVEGTLLRHLVAAAIGSRLNATCAIDHFHWNGWNRAEIRGLSLRVKDWPEIASEVISIGSMSADFDPLPLLWGSLALTDISIDRMTIRVIERRGDRELNILDLRLPDTRGSTVRPPRINISDLALHVGELDERKGELRFEGRHDLVGSVTSDEQVRGQWKLVLTQKGAGDSPPATLEGTLSGADFDYSVTLRNLELDESIERLMPRGVLPMWEELGIRGRIDAVTLAGSRDQQVREARIRVSDISVTLPKTIGMEEIWARYRHGAIEPDVGGPRILVRSGEMEFRDWMLVLRELRGELTSSDESQQVVPLPMSLSFWIDLYRGRTQIWSAASAREWAETAFEHAPFGLHLQVENYTMREVDGEAPTLELPRLAAEILHNFQVRQGRVSIDAYVTRDEPFWRGEEPRESPPLEGPIASEIQVRGSLLINEGEGAYFKFPYLLTDVQAHITFENDLVEVERLRGKGSGGSEILVSGTVIDPGDDAGVDLRIMTASAPIDEALEGALVDSPAQRFLKLLFCRPAFESLLEAGLPGSEVSRMRERRERLLRSLAETDSTRAPDPDRVKSLTEGPWPRPEPQKRRAGDPAAAEAIRRFASIDWLSRFRPGGRCALDLRVRRDVGGGDLVETTGRIVLIESDALCEPLPYPIHVLGRDIVGAAAATITVEDERIVLPDGGLRIQLPGGGSGSIQGWIDLPRTSGNDRIVIPHLTVRNSGDAINDLLLAAIPVDNPSGPILGPSNGWPGTRRSETATLLERIGLEGVLDTVIEIGGDGKGAITWRLDLELSDGTAKPRESLGADVAESGLEWPQGFDLDRCRAKVLVDERTARLSEFEGHADDGIVRARGSVDLVSLDRELSVDFENIGAHEYLVNLLPHSDRETGRSFWHRHEPAGAFDASLRWDHDEDGATRRELVVRPRWFSFTADPPGAEPPFERRRVEVRHRAGDVAILGSTITARGFEIDVDEAGLPVSRLSIDGVLAAPERNARGALRAAWTGADLSSSALLEGLSLADADEAVELWSSLRPSGRFDAELGLDPAGPGLERVPRATARLRRVDATVDGVATSLEVEPSSSPVEIRPPLVRFADFRA